MTRRGFTAMLGSTVGAAGTSAACGRSGERRGHGHGERAHHHGDGEADDARGDAAPPRERPQRSRSEWPTYRGTSGGAAVNARAKAPNRNPSVRWSRAMSQYSSLTEPVVADGTIYLTGYEAAGGRRSTFAVSASDGSVRWRREDDRRYSPPAVDDGVLYQVGADGTIRALRTDDGAEAFVVPFATDGREVSSPAAPRVDGDRIYAARGGAGDDEGYVVAVARDDREVDWRTTVRSAPSAPARVSVPAVVGDALYATVFEGGVAELRAFDASTGEAVWTRELGSAKGVRLTHPVATEEGVYIREHGSDGALLACDAADGSVRWRHRSESADLLHPPTVAGDSVYVSHYLEGRETADPPYSAKLHALDAETGDPRWTAAGPYVCHELGGDQCGVEASQWSPAAADHHAVYATFEGAESLLRAYDRRGSEGELLWETSFDAWQWLYPVPAGSSLYVFGERPGGVTGLYALKKN